MPTLLFVQCLRLLPKRTFFQKGQKQDLACLSAAPGYTDTPSMYPQFPCHTSTAVMDLTQPHQRLSPYQNTLKPPVFPSSLSVSSSQVKKQLERLNQNKAAGPDGESPKKLAFAEQLCGILQHLFNLGLSHGQDWLFLAHLRKQVNTFQDPLQYAYCPGVGVEDAIICLLRWAHSHVDKAGTMVRLMYCDFFSAFDTNRSVCMVCEKLRWMPPQPPRLLNTSQTVHSLGDSKDVCLRRWSAAQEHHRELYSHHFSSLCTPQTSSITQSPVISRDMQMSLQLLVVLVMDKRLVTGNWSINCVKSQGLK